VISIAHRLNTIYASDKILILDKGCIKAFGNYKNFNEDEKQFFYQYIEDLKKGIIQ
jgi:ABC-type multidrug transport system fused ATPase/permease subunit